MHFKENYWYHIFNRGNNQQRIYFNRQNYLFFIGKIRKQILPFANVLAYCLMPNHFHLLVHVKPRPARWACGPAGEKGNKNNRAGGKNSRRPGIHPLVHKIGILQSSYTQAINKQRERTGSLFQSKTKAKNLSSGTRNYAVTCFYYIHQNPVEAGLVDKPEDWSYSSYRDYAGLRAGTLPAQKLGAKAFGFTDKHHFIKRSQQTISEEEIENIY